MTDDAALISRLETPIDTVGTSSEDARDVFDPLHIEAAARIAALVHEKGVAWKSQADMAERYVKASQEGTKQRLRAEAVEAERDALKVELVKSEQLCAIMHAERDMAIAALEKREAELAEAREQAKDWECVADLKVLNAEAARADEREKAARMMETTLPHLSLQEYAAAIRRGEGQT